MGPRAISESSATKSWPSVEGAIDEVRIDRDVRLLSSDSGPRYRPVVSYTYEWNAENQLVRVTKDAAEVATFKYDPLGRRLEKVAGGVTYSYVYDGPDILRESRSNGATYTYLHGPGIDVPLAREDGAADRSYYHADGLGSISRLTGPAGSVVQSYEYDAWGNIESGASTPGYAYTGREWDPETGLYYYRARYYDPKVGRFISEDPIGLRGGINRFLYVGANPSKYTDPFGLEITVSDSYTPSAQQTVMALVSALLSTEAGAELFGPLANDPTRVVVIAPDALESPRFNPETNTIYLNVRGQYPIETENGFEIIAPILALAHELGHAAAPECLQSNELRNVNFIENRIRRELGFPDRVSYEPAPGTPEPPWVEEYQELRRRRVLGQW